MKSDRMQQLLLKDKPLMEIYPTGECVILDFDRLPFALRREEVSFVDFMEWTFVPAAALTRTIPAKPASEATGV